MYKAAIASLLVIIGYLQQTNETAANYIASAVQNTKTAIINDDARYFERELIEPATQVIDYATAAAVRKASVFTTLLDDIELDLLPVPDDAPVVLVVDQQPRQTHHELGTLSAKYESRGDAGAIGWDSTGGWSYGKYQIATKVGTMIKFMDWLADNHPKYHKSLSRVGGAQSALNGDDAFKQAWQLLAKDNGFKRAQHEFIADTHYIILANKLLKSGLNLNNRSHALRDVAWSTAVQHGGNTDVFSRCLTGSDADIIHCVYKVRATKFGRSTKRVQAAVKQRFINEQKQALIMLGAAG